MELRLQDSHIFARAVIRALGIGALGTVLWFTGEAFGYAVIGSHTQAWGGITSGDVVSAVAAMTEIVSYPVLAITLLTIVPFIGWEVYASRSRPARSRISRSMIFLIAGFIAGIVTITNGSLYSLQIAPPVIDALSVMVGAWMGLTIPNHYLNTHF